MEKDSNLFPLHLSEGEETNKEPIEDILERLNKVSRDRMELIGEETYFHRNPDNSFTKTPIEGPTRLSIIGKDGIIYSNHNCEFELDWQDNNKTLKIFIK